MSNCQLCTHDIDNHGKDGCYTPGCNCQRTHLHTDHPDYAELARENADLRANLAGTKMFPLQSSYSKTTPHPTMIPWAVADKAYAVYRGRYGAQQTLERLAERGGFSAGEMDDLYPGWREEVALVTDLRAKLADAEQVIADYTTTIREYMAAEKAAKATRGEPMAWMVFLPKGEEYDYAVFPRVEDAKQHAELLDADEEEGAEPRGVIPLYAGCDKA